MAATTAPRVVTGGMSELSSSSTFKHVGNPMQAGGAGGAGERVEVSVPGIRAQLRVTRCQPEARPPSARLRSHGGRKAIWIVPGRRRGAAARRRGQLPLGAIVELQPSARVLVARSPGDRATSPLPAVRAGRSAPSIACALPGCSDPAVPGFGGQGEQRAARFAGPQRQAFDCRLQPWRACAIVRSRPPRPSAFLPRSLTRSWQPMTFYARPGTLATPCR